MTAQFHDTFLLNDKDFSVVGVNGNELFNPQSIGIIPLPFMSACWRGFVCHYKINNIKLILDRLQISLGNYEGAGKERKFIQKIGPTISVQKAG